MAWTHIENSEYSPTEEALNVLTHGGGLFLGILGTLFALYQAESPLHLWSISIYSTTLILLFLSSTLYHSFHHQKTKALLQKLDHSAIFLFIAGSYTPYLLISLEKSSSKWPMFAIIWTIAIAGVLFKLVFGSKYSKASLATYLGMGWLILAVAKDIFNALPAPALILLVAGGLCFTGGAAFYANDKIKFNHAIWHVFVLAGVTCHFFSIYHYVLFNTIKAS